MATDLVPPETPTESLAARLRSLADNPDLREYMFDVRAILREAADALDRRDGTREQAS